MKIISFFNHKGGVGKTTQLYNLAWSLTLKGKRVLMVDADSQCNLSTVSLGEDGFVEHYENHPNDNIKSGLAPAFEAKPQLITSVICPQVQQNDKLYLLPGSFDISENETQLGVAINFNLTFMTMTNLPGSFYQLISTCADVYTVDYVLIDLNPGLSSINQTLLFSSDYFIVPCGVDYFSKQAVISLSKVLPIWCKWSENAKIHFKDSVYPMPIVKSKFLGYTVNNFTTNKGKPAKAVSEVILQLNENIINKLVPALTKTGNIVLQDEYKIAEIKNFNTLQQTSHKVNKPVFLLTDEDTKNTGIVAETQEVNIKQLKQLFNEFADYVILKTNNGN